jgi:hypothetical protein
MLLQVRKLSLINFPSSLSSYLQLFKHKPPSSCSRGAKKYNTKTPWLQQSIMVNTVQQIVAAYKAAEDAAKKGLALASQLDQKIGNKAATKDERNLLEKLLKNAFKEGHEYVTFTCS